MSENLLCRDVGRKPERPFVIKAQVRETSLGDLLGKLVCLATLKNQFDYAELEVRYRDVRPYSSEAMMLVPDIDRAVGIRWDIPVWARFGLPDTRLWHPIARSIDGNKWSWGTFCDFSPTDWMLNSRWLHAIPNPVPLRIPAELEKKFESELLSQGLKRDKWFAVLHYRLSNYRAKRSGQLRNSEPKSFLGLANHIIEKLGGQVVLLGHPGLDTFPAREGFVDLSRIPDAFLIQAYAMRNARFMIAGPSGPVQVGRGFQIPTAMVDASDAVGGWGPAEDVILSYEVTTPDGNKLRNRDLFEAGLFDYRTLRDKIRAGENFTVRKCSADELSAVADHLYDATAGQLGWRGPAPEYSGPRANHFIWPPQTTENLKFIDV